MFFALCEYSILLLHLRSKDDLSSDQSQTSRKGPERTFVSSFLPEEKERKPSWWANYKGIDGFSLILFPMAFIFFNVGYWMTYL